MRANTHPMILAATVAVLLAAALPAAALDLNGGTTTFTFPEDIDNQKASISVSNKTGIQICDFIITVGESAAEVAATAPAFNITGATVNDEGQASDNWLVDDDKDGTLDVAGGENDTTANPAGDKVRIEEEGKDDCIKPGKTASLELDFDANPRKNDTLKISPTSKAGGVIFNTSLPGCASVHESNVLFPTGDMVLVNATGEPIFELPVSTSDGIEVLAMESSTHGGFFDHATRTYTLEVPLSGGDVLLLGYELSGFNPDGGATTVCLGDTVEPGSPGGRADAVR